MILQILDVLRGKAVVIPKKPTRMMLFNMAVKENHGFGFTLPDDEIEKMRAQTPLINWVQTESEKQYTLAKMKELYETIVEISSNH